MSVEKAPLNNSLVAHAEPRGLESAEALATVSPMASLVRSLPTLAVLCALGGIGWWGHAHEWRIPPFAELFGPPNDEEEAQDWCAEHSVPESRCIKCKPALLGEAEADWCREHGVSESRCTLCHPEILLTGVANDWCAGHGLPESSCTICHPEIVVRGTPPNVADAPSVYEHEGHEHDLIDATPKDAILATSPVRNPATCQTHALRVQFASVESIEKAGVRLESVVERPMRQSIGANAEIQYDPTRLARVTARVPGVVWRINREIGDSVQKGELLALLDSADVGTAKAELLAALAQRELRRQTMLRIERLLPLKLGTDVEFQEAQAALREADVRTFNARQVLANFNLATSLGYEDLADERELRLLGLSADVRTSLSEDALTANLLPIFAPLDGIVLERNVVSGEVVDAFAPLFVIGDVRQVWLSIDVPQAEAGRIKVGMPVRFVADPNREPADGRISWISTAVDDEMRVVRARAVLDNADGRLLANSFGRAEIVMRSEPKAVAVSNEAIHWEGCCHVVFVRITDDVFQTRKVRPGTRDSLFTEILVGLAPGEVVATAGSHVLKSEILKSNLGAGCCEPH